MLRREPAEPGELDVVALLERVGDPLEERVDSLRGVAALQTRPLRYIVHELLFRHYLSS
jgi:hypothetical protein